MENLEGRRGERRGEEERKIGQEVEEGSRGGG